MEELVFKLVDYSTLRRIKPWQNLALIIVVSCWILSLILLLFQNQILNIVIAGLFAFSSICLAMFFIFFFITLVKKKVGQLHFLNGMCRVSFNGDVLEVPFTSVLFKINVLNSTINYSTNFSKMIKTVPKWSNYILIIHESQQYQFEFEPNEALGNILSKENTLGYEKIPLLLCKTSDIFRDLFWMLWAAS